VPRACGDGRDGEQPRHLVAHVRHFGLGATIARMNWGPPRDHPPILTDCVMRWKYRGRGRAVWKPRYHALSLPGLFGYAGS
jgi:hypothetical protein